MSDILMTIIGIFLAVIIMFIFPLMELAGENDEVAQTVVQVAVSDFVNKAASKGKITYFDYNMLIQKLHATGNNFDVQIEVQIIDDNPRRATTTGYNELLGEYRYYSVYTNEILNKVRESELGEYELKKDDYIIVTVKNTNITIGTHMKNFVYNLMGKDTSAIGTTSSAVVLNGANEYVNKLAVTPPYIPPAPPSTITISGSKTWEDSGNIDGKRPSSITINLLKNGTKIDSKTVRESDGWSWSFANLREYDDAGNRINYSITEEIVPGYTTNVIGYNITNSYTPAPANPSITYEITKYIKEIKYTMDNKDIIFILDESGSMSAEWDDLELACNAILDNVFSKTENTYFGFVCFGSSAEKIGSIISPATSAEINNMKTDIANKYGGNQNAGTNFNSGFQTAINMINNELINTGRTNERIVIFMADGTCSYNTDYLRQLIANYGVSELYSIFFEATGWQAGFFDVEEGRQLMIDMANKFKEYGGIAEMYDAKAEDITAKFEEILNQIKSEQVTNTKTETEYGTKKTDEYIDITGAKTLKITVTQNGVLVGTIEETSIPNSSTGFYIVEGGTVKIGVEALLRACGLTNFEGVTISIDYFES